jgi:hypothetical protein
MPRYPSIVGNWSRTLTVENVVTPGGARHVNACNETWGVTTQIEGQFTGTFQRSCGESGSMNGTVSMSGDVTGLTFNVMVGRFMTSTCLRVLGDGVYTGLLNGASLMAQTAERTFCIAGGGGLQFDGSFSLSMSKQ